MIDRSPSSTAAAEIPVRAATSNEQGRPLGRPSRFPERIAWSALALLWLGAVIALVDQRHMSETPDRASLVRSDEGWLTLRFRLSPENSAGFSRVLLESDWAGASRHPVRDAGWRRIPLRSQRSEFELERFEGSATVAAEGRLKAGTYNRILVSTPIGQAWRADGEGQDIVSHIEPIARGFDLVAGATVEIEIDLVLRAGASDPLGRPEIFVMDARLVEPNTTALLQRSFERRRGLALAQPADGLRGR